jgi:hypothetical protein
MRRYWLRYKSLKCDIKLWLLGGIEVEPTMPHAITHPVNAWFRSTLAHLVDLAMF